MLQKWNNEATNIHKEASNIFSLDSFNVCNETNLLIASKIKKFEIIKLGLCNNDGKNIRNKK